MRNQNLNIWLITIFVFLTGCTSGKNRVDLGGVYLHGVDDKHAAHLFVHTSTGDQVLPDSRYMMASIDKENQAIGRFFIKTDLHRSRVNHTFQIKFTDLNGKTKTVNRSEVRTKVLRSRKNGRQFMTESSFPLTAKDVLALSGVEEEFVNISMEVGYRYKDERGITRKVAKFGNVRFKTADGRNLVKGITKALEEL